MTACRVRRYFDPDGGAGTTQAMPQQFTSWEAIYETLRATFPDDRYHMGAAVSDVEQQGSQVIVTLNGERKVTSDLLLAADGANSALRHRFLPDAAPNYAGYVAWRGTLDESDTPPPLLAFFDDAFTFSEARSGGHILAYFIPGEGADVRPGRRRLNWVWYVRADEIELAGALVDKDGKRHHASLPEGLVSSDAVSKLRSRAKREVHSKLAELVAATRDPFMQTIVDVTVTGTGLWPSHVGRRRGVRRATAYCWRRSKGCLRRLGTQQEPCDRPPKCRCRIEGRRELANGARPKPCPIRCCPWQPLGEGSLASGR